MHAVPPTTTASAAHVDGLRKARAGSARDLSAFGGKYLSVTTFRGDGSPVATPVWFVRDCDRLLAETDRDSGKIRRLRRDPRALIAPCTAMGRLTGEQVDARIEILPDLERVRAERLLKRKYRFDRLYVQPIRAIQSLFQRDRKPETPVIMSIEIAAQPAEAPVPWTDRVAA